MSENKYIIDKDSLTGIADAVRNKLGVGEVTTDPQTGDIVYPEGKGYYLKDTTVAKISGFGWSYTGYSGNFGRNYSPLIEDTYWDEAVGEPWYSVEITLVNVRGNDRYNMDIYYSGGGYQSFTNVKSSTYTVSAPNGSTYFDLQFSNTYSSSRWNGSSSLGSLTAIFKDAEGKPIRPKQSSYQYRTYDSVVHTANFGTIGVETPIPFSIDDIQNKITDYLEKKEAGIGIAIFAPSNFPNVTFGDLSKYNKISTSGYYCLNFNDNTYLSNTIPTIRPENILYLEYVGNSYTYIFNVNTAPIEHYTSATINDGKRLSSATDYYYYKDTDGDYKTGNGGILGMWDDVNKQLDLGFQAKQSASGNSISTAYCSWYGNYCHYMVIVYKEATE